MDKCFRRDENEAVNEVEFTFFKRYAPSGDPANIRWDWPITPDIETINVSDVIFGPATPILENKKRGKSLFRFKEAIVHEIFARMEKCNVIKVYSSSNIWYICIYP